MSAQPAESRPGAGRSPLRRLPVPDCQPPYDDELDSSVDRARYPGVHDTATRGRAAPVQGTLALAFVLPGGLPAVPVAPPGLRLVPDLPHGHPNPPGGSTGLGTGQDTAPVAGRAPTAAAAEVAARADEAEFGPQQTGSHALPEARGWSSRFVQAVVEVLCGTRPVGQLVRWTSLDVYDAVCSLIAPPPAPGHRAPPPRAVVRSVRVTEPVDGVAEVSATVRRGPRTCAVALRLEGLDGRWQCTALEVGYALTRSASAGHRGSA